MGWSFRKSLRLLPGVRLNLSKNGPRLSLGVLGIRANIGNNRKARVYAGWGPFRYQKTITIGQTAKIPEEKGGLVAFVTRLLRDL
jgi:hypothetical protein